MEKFYTVTEVAEYLKVSQYTIRRYIKNREINSVKLGKFHRISEEALETYLNSRRSNREDD